MSWFRSLRSYAPMRRRSAKVEQSEADWQAVYQLVDARSAGRCEFTAESWVPAPVRCPRPARQHHHVMKPRRAHHDPDHVVHLCLPHHERCEWPYQRGRLVVDPEGAGAFRFRVLYAPDKFSLRAERRDDPAESGPGQ